MLVQSFLIRIMPLESNLLKSEKQSVHESHPPVLAALFCYDKMG